MDAKVIDVYLMQSHSLLQYLKNLIYLLNEPTATLSAPKSPRRHRKKRMLEQVRSRAVSDRLKARPTAFWPVRVTKSLVTGRSAGLGRPDLTSVL